MHLRLIDPHATPLPGVPTTHPTTAADDSEDHAPSERSQPAPIKGVAPEKDAKAFNLWLRDRWQDKEDLLESFAETGRFTMQKGMKEGLVVGPLTEVAIRF